MPYNYLVDETIWKNYSIDLENTILIFDEAHNITQVQEEASSFEIKTKMLDMCLDELLSLQTCQSQNNEKKWSA